MKKPATEKLDPRLAVDADQKPKSMISVGSEQRPFLDYLLLNAQQAGYDDIVIVVGERDLSIRACYGPLEKDNLFHKLRISYAVQSIPQGRTKPLGTADALLCALHSRHDWTGGRFTVCNSDNLYSRRALQLLLESEAPSAMIDYDRDALLFSQERIAQFAVVEKDHGGRLLRIIEKPSAADMERAGDPKGRISVSMNIFRLLYDRILPFLETVPLHPIRQEKELPTAIMMMLSQYPGSLLAIPLAEHVPDLTHQDDIFKVQQFLERHYPILSW